MSKINIEDRIERWAESVPLLAKPSVKNALLIAFVVLYVGFGIAMMCLCGFLLSKVPFLVREDVQDFGQWLWIVFCGMDLFVCRPLKNRFGERLGFRCFSNVILAICVVAILVRGAGLFAGVI